MKMKTGIFLFLIFAFNATFAQYRLEGQVRSITDSSSVAGTMVYLDNSKISTVTDDEGKFAFLNVTSGDHTLHFTGADFMYHSHAVSVAGDPINLKIFLQPYEQTLEEVMISDVGTGFGFSRLRSVDGFGIYEGKKSEVVVPDQLVANLSTNNARQIYSRVAGLNIWENDGAGLQLSIGGRGLDPNRSSNFNVRQNGYDISADALGYPESYYTPPSEAIGKIEIVRGAASLQYGTQFGGYINFSMKKPVANKRVELVARQTLGSFGFYNAFNSVSGSVNKVSYYSFFQFKRGDGWRNNSQFDNHTFYANINYAVNAKSKIGIDVTQMGYLAQQPGGLTDEMFQKNPRQTNRSRNWFKVNWNLFALHFDHKFNSTTELNARVFGLSAYRYSIGFRPNRVATVDDSSERDLIKGYFNNWGTELRFLKRYHLGNTQSVLLTGVRYYQGHNESLQGNGSTGSDANFEYGNRENDIMHDYTFPNKNTAAFLENIFYINDQFSVTPGVRFEYIRTRADGFYRTIFRDLTGEILEDIRADEDRVNSRHFLLGGVGLTYRPTSSVEIYSNISENYRSITFSDMRISNPSSVIDQNLQDESGYSIDFGLRSEQTKYFSYDVSVFYLNYSNRIGEVQFYDSLNRVMRLRSNIGKAIIRGVESYAEADVIGLLRRADTDWAAVVFNNLALITSDYRESDIPGVEGKEVEFIPAVNWKTGLRVRYKNAGVSFQYSYLSQQFTDATNAPEGGVSAIVGVIPAYGVADFTASYTFRKFKIEGSVNNVANQMYFTRRATGYPGPGILPSDGRSFFMTLQVKL